MSLKLHCFGESGHSYKAALALELSGLKWQPVFVDFFNGATRSIGYRTHINSMGEVPVLVDGNLKLSQSGVIQDYISQKTGRFCGDFADERREILRWVLWDNHKLSSIAGTLRFMTNFLPEAKRSDELIGYLRKRLNNALKLLDTHLADRDWISGAALSNADMTCCAYLYYPEPFGFERRQWSNIDRWLNNISATPGWKAPYDLMPGSPADRT